MSTSTGLQYGTWQASQQYRVCETRLPVWYLVGLPLEREESIQEAHVPFRMHTRVKIFGTLEASYSPVPWRVGFPLATSAS